MAHSAILKPGVNCWRIEHADRAAFLVDGAEFFRAFRETVKQAQRSVLIIAWDIDSRIDLVREGKPDGLPVNLSAFLNCMVQRTPIEEYLTWVCSPAKNTVILNNSAAACSYCYSS